MLRGIFLENFVTFQGKQKLEFIQNESPSIFVGENGSGKSAMQEGIRRCLTSSASTTLSSAYDLQKPSYFVCVYDTRECSDDIFKEDKCLYTGIVLTLTQNIQTYYKFISTRRELLIDKYDSEGNLREFRSTNTYARQMFDDLKSTSLAVHNITNHQFTKADTLERNREQESLLEQRLKLLDEYVVMTFSLRTIGPLQWSKSERITPSKCQENYLEASDRAEIIRYFLDNPNKFDLLKEQTIFRDLTGHCDIEFELTGEKKIYVKSTETKLPGGEFALLKLPEGILEAKNFSILMSSKHFQTLVLEEPDRGMHPQMIERMLAIIQKESHNKVVVLTTHNPCFVSPLTVSRLTIFKRIRSIKSGNATKDYAEIISGNELASVPIPGEPKATCQSHISMKTLRIITRDHLADLIFARRIVFCEGDSDFLFLTSLKEKIIKMSPHVEHVLGLIADSDIASLRDTLQRICVSIQIINMNGWNNAKMMHFLCKYLKLEDHYFVCDKDAIRDDTVKCTRMKDNGWMDGYNEVKKKFDDNTCKWDENRWELVRDSLRTNSKCFAWRDGTIEDMVISLLRSKTTNEPVTRFPPGVEPGIYDTEVRWLKKGNVIDQLKQNNVRLPVSRWGERRPTENWRGQKRKRSDTEKLFLPFDVTQQNISESTNIFLGACDSITDDLVQFVIFLTQMANV